ncbi:monosaccharide ABC transporter membrane protein (CUT2 family) [Actinomadura pelletieri DSM 43383]|uniref:Monosaccharide ABC transporter membrane protein (CUT2 family) n=1 Tax=Actinomadura pelletieri DSM 43383 TaxID=1120940 RepID=A0A495QTN0_9ACTN|nr:ABC transporter permease [Actinomadura pelletieri]RKS76882.1 monosaccharide ABC transporter membrane protein (CUT2 family) [Actinomadura pelletieri DSM 43383]
MSDTRLRESTRKPTTPDIPRTGRLGATAERYGLVFLLVGVVVFFSVLPASSAAFTSTANVQSVLASIAVVSMLAVAAVFPLACGRFDFSVAATSLVSSIVCAALMSNHHAPLTLAVLCGVGAGVLVGLVNAVLVALLRLNAFIITIGMATLLPGLVQWYTRGVDLVRGVPRPLRDFGSLTWLGLPRVIWLVAVLTAVCWFTLAHTAFGRRLYAIGGNASAARLVGIPVTALTFAALVISGGLAGVAGVILTARNGGGLVNSGVDLLFPALAAVFLGATAIDPGRYNVLGAVIGTLFVAVSVSGLTLAGAAEWVPAVFNGAALIIAVAVSTLLARRHGTS